MESNAANGSRGETNGVSKQQRQQMVVPSEEEFLGPQALVNRREYLRLIEQALSRLGFPEVAAELERRSGVQLHSAAVVEFQQGLLAGRWERSLELLPSLIAEASSEARKLVHFLILEQKLLELLEAGETETAMWCLRRELQPLGVNTAQLHSLSMLLLCPSSEDLKTRAVWAGAGPASRAGLMDKVQALVPPSVMVPSGRLEELVEQALRAQVSACLFHNAQQQSLSLLGDYTCGREQLPSETMQVLDEHTDEVWDVGFSHNGRMLASASKDGTAIIWSIGSDRLVTRMHTLTGHEDALAFLSWSPSDEHLLTCSSDRTVRLWEVSSGRCLHVFRKHTDQVTAAAWMPDGKRIVSGGLDKHIFMWDLNGQELHRWNGARVNDLGITKDGRWMVTVCSEKKIRLFNFDEWREDCITETDSITSLSIADDSRHLLVNLASQEIHLWHLSPTVSGAAAPLPTAPVVKYRSLPGKMGRYVIRSCFGGANQPFVVSGGEDSQIYIFHRDKGDLLDVLSGHSGTVNAVSWNPRDPWMFCSASDDKSIRVWVSPVARGNQTSADTS